MATSVARASRVFVATTWARRTLTAPLARLVSTGLPVLRVAAGMSESGVAVQKSPRLSSPHLLRRYLNYTSWLDLDTIDHVCLPCTIEILS